MLKAVVFAAMLPMAICYAQADRAAVTGTITDQSHLAMASAHVRWYTPAQGCGVNRYLRLPAFTTLAGCRSASAIWR